MGLDSESLTIENEPGLEAIPYYDRVVRNVDAHGITNGDLIPHKLAMDKDTNTA
jgi:hypothetical protein